MHEQLAPLIRKLGPLFRSLTASSLFYSGVLSQRLRYHLKNRAVVLMYHRILPPTEIQNCPSHPGIIVSTDTFDAQMQMLRKRFHVLSPEDFMEIVEKELPFPPMSCLVTFDDGWIDNRTYAQPILEKYRIPALIFLAAGYIGTTRKFWQESMTGAILAARKFYQDHPETDDRILSDPDLAVLTPCLQEDDLLSRDAISRLVPSFKKQPIEAAFRFTRKLRAAARLPEAENDQERHFLDWTEVNRMRAEGVCFGSHGLNHRILTHPETDFSHEISESQQVLQQKLDGEMEAFSYPNGAYNSEIAEQVRNQGFQLAFSTRRGHVSQGDDRFTLKRNNIYEGATRTIPMFLARILGIW